MDSVKFSDAIRTKARKAFPEFSESDSNDNLWAHHHKVSIEHKDIPLPGILFLLLAEGFGFRNLGMDEKTAWQIRCTYKELNLNIAYAKFGLRIYIAKEDVPDEKVAQAVGAEIIQTLMAAVEWFEKKALTTLADKELKVGNFKIANQLPMLLGMYTHFRNEALTSFEQADELGYGQFRESHKLKKIGAWNALASISAYFSALEHKFVLLLAFVPSHPPGGDALKDAIGDRWSDKFKRLFDLPSDAAANKAFNRLKSVSETYRNTYGHGGFDKGGGALWFYVSGAGPVPARLTNTHKSPEFQSLPIDIKSFKDACTNLDETDSWLNQTYLGLPLRIVAGGIDIGFDSNSRAEYQQAIQSESSCKAFMEDYYKLQDKYANMEW